jgi:hypothetical protein
VMVMLPSSRRCGPGGHDHARMHAARFSAVSPRLQSVAGEVDIALGRFLVRGQAAVQ